MISNIFNNKKNIYLSLVLFFIILIFSIWSKPNLIPNLSSDSGGYIRLAKDFHSDISEIRPFFFPLFIRMCIELNEVNWESIFSIIQIIFHASLTSYLFWVFQKFQIKRGVAFLLTLCIGLNPNLIYYTTYVLADYLFAVITTISWIYTIKYNEQFYTKEKKIINLVIIGVFSGLAIVTKPIALLLIFPIIFSILCIHGVNIRIMKQMVLLMILNFSFHFLWDGYKTKYNPQLKFELLDSIEVGINLTALRAGLVDVGVGTPLYNYIEEKNMLNTAREFKIKTSYTMDNHPKFWEFKQALSWEIKNDKAFALQILNREPWKIFIASISNWHSFFTKRCFYPGIDSFPGMPDSIRNIYVVGYAILYRPFLLILLIISFCILWRKKLYNLFYSTGSLLFYSSLTVTMLSAHGGEFVRYRVWVEYIMWFFCLIPIGYLVQFLLEKLNIE